MKLAQRKTRWLTRLMLGLVLFAQGVVAANACVSPIASPAQAYVLAQDEDAMPCHEQQAPNANACLTHCTQSDQISVDQHEAPVAVPLGALAWTVPQPQAQSIRPLASFDHLALDTGPPIPIRFCSLLN
ncbi:MAG: hypothetical protein HY306_01715 [Nitrosomonadales bacterium]|nr:hypothetical protein [Nitrosomonadales bacterium]